MKHLWIAKLFIVQILVCVAQNATAQTSSALPRLLQPCYRNNFTMGANPPITLSLLTELIRKIELGSQNSINMRILATSMLRSVIFDGVRRHPTIVPDNDDVIPYRATGEEFYKYQVLVDYLIPGQTALFPADLIILPELCFLHSLLSSTVDPYERGDERYTCQDQSYMPLIIGNTGRFSNCPQKKGIIQTKWGPISASQLISGIAGGLQDNQVTFGKVVEAIKQEEIELASYSAATSTSDVNSVWVATLAGDLSRAILSQGTGNPVIGTTGYWNDTILPRAFYLTSNVSDMTEPDILGGIDGAVLGTYIQSWLKILDSIRLSQIIDMYYSERGIPFGYVFRANNRSLSFETLLNNVNLQNQIIGSAKLLQEVGKYGGSPTEEIIGTAAEHLKTIAGKIASEYDGIEYVNGKQLTTPIELITILDGSFDQYKAQQLIYALAESIQVSYYGSRLGIINGQSGNWISNVSESLFQIFADLNDLKDEWPATLSLGRSLQTAIWHYQNKTFIDCSAKTIKPRSQAIIIFSQDGRLTNDDLDRSRRSLTSIKTTYPDVRIIFVTSRDSNSLRQLLLDDDDSVMLFSSTDILALVTQIIDRLDKFPANIIKFYCNDSQVIFEDYITPLLGSSYEINREYLNRGYYDMKFKNYDYGDLIVCAFIRNSTSSKVCRNLPVNNEITIRSRDFCTSGCSLQFQVEANTTRIRCAEYDCRYPDQIRMDILYTYRATGSVFLPTIVIVVNLLLIIVR